MKNEGKTNSDYPKKVIIAQEENILWFSSIAHKIQMVTFQHIMNDVKEEIIKQDKQIRQNP